MKICKRCKIEKQLEDFYKHKRMKDGTLSFCKECTRKRVSKYYYSNLEYHRKKEAKRYKKRKCDPAFIEKKKKYTNNWRKEHKTIRNWFRKMKHMRPQNCSMCNKSIGEFNGMLHGHHEDYSKPYDVIWLCPACHKQLHLSKI